MSAAPESLRLGIVGAGKFGTTLARAALASGYDVALSGSGSADDIALTVGVLAPGARAATTAEVVRDAGMVVLAIPLHRFRELPDTLFDGKIVIDAMNYWQPVDGDDPELAGPGSSELVQSHLPSARVVKSLNQLGYHEFEELRRPAAAADRIAIGAAGDDQSAVAAVTRLIERLGFDPVGVGPLERGRLLEADGSPFAVAYTADQLAELTSEKGRPSGTDRPSAGSLALDEAVSRGR